MTIRKQIAFVVFAVASSLLQARADTIVGPTLNHNIGGFKDTGLEFTALRDATLEGFVFQNQGLADQIILENATTMTVLDTLSTPANVTSYTATGLEWALTAGSDYLLLATTSSPKSNGKYAAFSSYPQADADISVNYSTLMPGLAHTTSYWADFNDITTAAVPEPSSFTLLGIGLLGGLVWYRRRRRCSRTQFNRREGGTASP